MFDYAHKMYVVTMEGFASPLNSQLLLITPEARFCSLFSDTDRVYRSLGNFFDSELVGKGAIINPPFVVDIMNRVARKCIAECERAESNGEKIRLFLKLDGTQDGEFYELLCNSRFLRGVNHFRRYEYWSDETSRLGATGSMKVIGHFNLLGFVLTSGHDDAGHDYRDLWQRMQIPWLQRLPVYRMRGRRRVQRLLARVADQC